MFNRKLYVVALVACAMALLPSPSQAQSTAGKLRLNLDTRLLGITAGTGELDEAPHTETKVRKFEIGLGSPEFGIGVGYTVIDGLVIGGRLTLAFSGTKTDPEGNDNNDKLHVFGLRILPYVEYGFNIGKVVPFVMATLGFRSDLNKDIAYEAPSEPYYKEVTNMFVFGGGGGAHFFLAEAFSIDATLLFMGDVGKLKTDDDQPGHDPEYKVRAFEMAVLIGMSGWLGGTEKAAPATTSTAPATTYSAPPANYAASTTP
jgi:hypothetical protein